MYPVQFHAWDQNIKAFAVNENVLICALGGQTKGITLTSNQNYGIGSFVPVLDNFVDGDHAIGVFHYATICTVDDATIIAVCSDASVRIWNGSRWGEDLAEDYVKSEIKKMMPGAVGAYYSGAYYIWYRTDSSKTYNDTCLRYAVKKEAGQGWTFCTGDYWIKPFLYTGVSLIQDVNDIQRLIVLDNDYYLYWIEPFDAYSGSNLSETYADKKIDGGFCPLNDHYWYDELDDSSLNSDLQDWSK